MRIFIFHAAPQLLHERLIHPSSFATHADGNTTVVIKDVPADICKNCGESCLTEELTARVTEMAQEAVQRNAEIEVLRFAAYGLIETPRKVGALR